MRLRRETYTPTAEECEIPTHLQVPGIWLIEVACKPPRQHQPAAMLALSSQTGAMALSLRTDTLLGMNVGAALVQALDNAGCRLNPLAPLALHEVLVNAAMHGNLAIETGPAATWTDLAARQELIATALQQDKRRKRLVTVALAWNAAQAIAVIADQGNGYNVGASTQFARQETNRLRGAGRGLLLARSAAQIDVQNGGRCTRLTFCRHDAETV